MIPPADCPTPDVLAGISSGREIQEAHLAHVAGCPACRVMLGALEGTEPLPEVSLDADAERAVLSRVRRRSLPAWMPWAAAAALLLAVFLRRGGEESPGPAPVPPAASISPPTFAGPGALVEASREEVTAALGQASALTLREGSRARILPQGVELLEGALWLENPGEPLILKAGQVNIRVEAATLLLERPVSLKASFWFSQALASEAGGRLVVLSGSAEVGWGGGASRRVSAGQEIPLGEHGSPRPAGALAWRGDGGWQGVDSAPRLGAGVHALSPEALPAAYVWEALLRRKGPASAGILFPAGGRDWQLPLGQPLDRDGWLRLRLEVKGGWVRLQVGDREVLREPESALGRMLEVSSAKGCGLKVWGGELQVAAARWRESR